MPDMHHVAVFDDVLFAFQAQGSAGAALGFRQFLQPASLGADLR